MNKQTFPYRGFMIDSVRHFMPVGEIRKMITAARICGMNRMHWHLTDDQGWRIEIRKYPELTKTGAVRGRTFFGGVSETENNNGYYTQDELLEVVRFAGENGMEVVPEIEMPGHASALLAAYPEYGCRRLPKGAKPWTYTVETAGGIFPNLVCAGRESTYWFLTDVLDEVMELFPSRMIHLGGDEALKIHWRRCPDCQRRIMEGSPDDEDDLQRMLLLRIGTYLSDHGRSPVVWSDVLKGGLLPPFFIVQQWMDDHENVRQFMAGGGNVISSDNRTWYFDYPYGATDVKKIWKVRRIPEWAEGYEQQLLGIECPLWSERITNTERAAFMLFPRLAAAGLKAKPEERTWEDFREEVRKTQQQIETLGLKGAPEEMWDMPADQAEADRQADRDRIYAPEAREYAFRSEQLVLLEKTERFMRQIGIPEGFLLQAGDRMLDRLYHSEPAEDPDGADRLIRQLAEAVESREYGAWSRIPENIWIDTMKCYPRFIAEHRRSYGRDGFDRGSWTIRQTGCRLFRIGELEYELMNEDGERAVSLHIPSDVRLEPELLNDSVRRADEFLRQYFPGWQELPVICESWLLSPKLKKLLPPEARILRFQEAFDLTEEDPDDTSALEWVFHVAEGQRDGLKIETLPETTSLQRGMKAMLLKGEKPGNARGVLARAFR